MESGHVVVKLSFAGETHRMKVDLNHFTFEALCAKVPETFGDVTPHAWTLVYTDNEGDLVTVASPEEYMEACRVFLRLNGDNKSMRFQVVSKVSVKDQIPPAVLQAVDDLASTLSRLATSTKENIAQSGYLEKGRASVAYSAKQTKDFLETARKEILQRWRDVHARVVTEIQRRRSRTASEAEGMAAFYQQQDMVNEAKEPSVVVIQSSPASEAQVAEEASVESHVVKDESNIEEEKVEEENKETVVEDDNESSPPPLMSVDDLVAPAQQHEEEEDEEETPYESDAETVRSSSSDEDDSDSEWDVVPDLWSSEVAMIRGILPHVHIEDCVSLLRKHSGNLEAVLIELTDM